MRRFCLGWKSTTKSPFFLWLHYFDPHLPLEPPAPYDQTFSHDLYRGEIAYADESLGAVMQRLRELEVEDNTLVIMTADHGEGHGEHRETTHSMLLYQATLHVPLVMRLPGGVSGRRVKERVGPGRRRTDGARGSRLDHPGGLAGPLPSSIPRERGDAGARLPA